jgi:hypothetical protein
MKSRQQRVRMHSRLDSLSRLYLQEVTPTISEILQSGPDNIEMPAGFRAVHSWNALEIQEFEAVEPVDGIQAQWYRGPHELLAS